MGWKITSAVAGIAAGFVARQVIKRGWEKITGEEAPDSPDDPRLTWGQAIALAAVSAVVMEVIRTSASRGAAQYYANKTARGRCTEDQTERSEERRGGDERAARP